nr:MAG TPA: hypothetical protein [Caudoviricetes sp.]
MFCAICQVLFCSQFVNLTNRVFCVIIKIEYINIYYYNLHNLIYVFTYKSIHIYSNIYTLYCQVYIEF